MDEPRLKTKEELRDQVYRLQSMLMRAYLWIAGTTMIMTEYERRQTQSFLDEVEQAMLRDPRDSGLA